MEVPGVTLAATCGLRWAVRIVMLSDPAVSRKLLSPVSASFCAHDKRVPQHRFAAAAVASSLLMPRYIHELAGFGDSLLGQVVEQNLQLCSSSSFVGE